MPLAAWRIGGDGPERLPIGAVDLEKSLESWIANDPGMIDAGLMVIQRQMHVEGGILDLLCVDPQGSPTVVEIKRGKLIRETIAQAIDYAASISTLPVSTFQERVLTYFHGTLPDHPGLAALLDSSSDADAREVNVVVVGVGQEPGLERIIDFLGGRFGVPIRVVAFDVFDLGDGQRMLVREEVEADTPTTTGLASSSSIDGVIAAAGGSTSANGQRMASIAAAAERNGLYVRPYKWSLMFTPPTKKRRYLITIWKWTDKDDLGISYSASAIAEFFPIREEAVIDAVGLQPGRHWIRSDSDADAWVARIDRLFADIAANQGAE
jgi:hypothetical protein